MREHQHVILVYYLRHELTLMKRKILFADDDEDMRFVIRQLLLQAGYTVELYDDLAFMNDKDCFPDLYLLDRHMDGHDLLEACRKLKADPERVHIPVVMFSADPRIKDEYAAAGANGCIEKPFDIHSFLEKISSFLK